MRLGMSELTSPPASSGLEGWKSMILFHTQTLKNSAFTRIVFLYCLCPIPPSQGLCPLLAGNQVPRNASMRISYRRSSVFVHAFQHNECLRYLLQKPNPYNYIQTEVSLHVFISFPMFCRCHKPIPRQGYLDSL